MTMSLVQVCEGLFLGVLIGWHLWGRLCSLILRHYSWVQNSNKKY